MDIVQDYVHQLRFAPCLREIKELYKKHCEYVDVITSNVFMWAEWAQCYEGDYIDEMYLENHIKEILRQDWFRNGKVWKPESFPRPDSSTARALDEVAAARSFREVSPTLGRLSQSVW